MRCPNCQHLSDTNAITCPACGIGYDRQTLETPSHVEYALAWLDQQADLLSQVVYQFGWTLRRRLGLPQAGIVLTAVGALLVAVDIAAIYQFGNLAAAVDLYWYWFATALLCTALHTLTAWRIPGTSRQQRWRCQRRWVR